MSKVKIDCLYDELVDIKKLKPHPKNNNNHPDDQIERLSKIISYQGMRSPIIISKRSGFITKGHGRLLALRKLKSTVAPVNYQDYLDEAQEYADITADNEIARWAELDLDKILENKDLLSGINIDMLGIPDLDMSFFNDIDIEVKSSNQNKNIDIKTKSNIEHQQEIVPDKIDDDGEVNSVSFISRIRALISMVISDAVVDGVRSIEASEMIEDYFLKTIGKTKWSEIKNECLASRSIKNK